MNLSLKDSFIIVSKYNYVKQKIILYEYFGGIAVKKMTAYVETYDSKQN